MQLTWLYAEYDSDERTQSLSTIGVDRPYL